MMLEKICKTCRRSLPEGDFYKNKKALHSSCKPCYSAKVMVNYRSNRARRLTKMKEWKEKNHEIYKLLRRNYDKERSVRDPVFKLTRLLRTRLNRALKGMYKTGSAVRDLGCSIVEFKLYLEKQFMPGMSWDNHGDWHIDHKIPLAAFDLTNPSELGRAVHYTNLQPLWARDNQRKGATI